MKIWKLGSRVLSFFWTNVDEIPTSELKNQINSEEIKGVIESTLVGIETLLYNKVDPKHFLETDSLSLMVIHYSPHQP